MMSLLSALALATPCPPPVAPEAPVQLGIDLRGHAVGGLAIVRLDGETWSLNLLSPMGLELFGLSGPPQRVDSAPEAWRPWLERLPFERDLRLAFTPVEARCAVADGRMRPRADGAHWRGAGGPARLERAGDRLVITDRRRGYALTLVVSDAP